LLPIVHPDRVTDKQNRNDAYEPVTSEAAPGVQLLETACLELSSKLRIVSAVSDYTDDRRLTKSVLMVLQDLRGRR
jgi:hypothetical protein